MRHFVVSVLLSICATTTLAESKPKVFVEDYSIYWLMMPEYRSQVNEGSSPQWFGDRSKYQWLYELLMPERDRTYYPEKSSESFYPHLKDSYGYFPHPDKLPKLKVPMGRGQKLTFQGTMTYVKVFPRTYKYDVIHEKTGELVIEVRVHFKKASAADQQYMADKIKEAQYLWNKDRPTFPFPYKFRFQVVRRESLSHFSVDLDDSTRGPYDVEWGLNWNGSTVAHELGHMMGLGDEYKTLTGEIDCLSHSLMCNSWYGDLMDHHYYQVLKRFADVNRAVDQRSGRDDNGGEYDWYIQ